MKRAKGEDTRQARAYFLTNATTNTTTLAKKQRRQTTQTQKNQSQNGG